MEDLVSAIVAKTDNIAIVVLASVCLALLWAVVALYRNLNSRIDKHFADKDRDEMWRALEDLLDHRDKN